MLFHSPWMLEKRNADNFTVSISTSLRSIALIKIDPTQVWGSVEINLVRGWESKQIPTRLVSCLTIVLDFDHCFGSLRCAE